MNHKEFNYPQIKPEYLDRAQYRIHPMQKTIAIGTAVVIVAMVLLLIMR